ncbi:MAG: MoxR family ATPase [Pseudomonadota bacterium]
MNEQHPSRDDGVLADELAHDFARAREQIGRQIIGQQDVVELVVLTLLVGGNSLLMGVPGLAKTMLVNTVARVLDLNFSRIQFTPDLMPSDITGTDLVQEDADTGRRSLVFQPGPVFTNILLADEINRTPPKTQAALLEAMQEKRVTVQGTSYTLEPPFLVFATQNPIELEGTYPLPEAQLDRFMFEIVMGYLSPDEEFAVVNSTTGADDVELEPVIDAARLLAYQQLVRRVPLAESVGRYALALVRATRPSDPTAPDFVHKWLTYGASVRAAQYLVLGGKARAVAAGRTHVDYADIRAVAEPVLRHRLITNFQAEADGVSAADIVAQLLESIPAQSA